MSDGLELYVIFVLALIGAGTAAIMLMVYEIHQKIVGPK